jgi:hypothetical protein
LLQKRAGKADVDTMNCPKCGFQQNERSECLRCGLIFARFHAAPPPSARIKVERSPLRTTLNHARSFYRIFRWVSLAILILILVLMLHRSTPPQVAVLPDSAQQADDKIQQFQSAIIRGTKDRLKLDQPELNGWLSANLALKKPDSPSLPPQTQESLISLAKAANGGHPIDQASVQEVQSSIRDVKIELRQDTLLLYAVFDMHGMDLSMELEGRLSARDGYMILEPTAGKLGSLPLTSGTLRAVADRLFNSPENREKFKLPPYVQDIGIEKGNLVVTSR